MKTRFAVLLTVLLISAGVYALEPFTLGSIIKLGSSTTAGLPASSSTIAGGLIYVSDDAGVLWNDGTKWNTFGGGGSGSTVGNFWIDAGQQGFPSLTNGFIYPNAQISSADGGPTVFTVYNNSVAEVVGIYNNVNAGTAEGYLGFHINGPYNPGSLVGVIYATASSTGGQIAGLNVQASQQVTTGIYPSVPGSTAVQVQTITGSAINGYKPFQSQVATGNNGFACITNGCRIDLGSGANDYFVGNATNISTPGAFAVGSFATGSLPAAATVGAGALAYDSTLAQPTYSNGTSWLPTQRVNFFGSAVGATPINNFAVLGYGYVAGPAVATRISCTWAGGTGGGALYVSLTDSAFTDLCTCTPGACAGGNIASCSCPYTFTSAQNVSVAFRTVFTDGGVASVCGTNPIEVKCNVN